MAKGITIDLTKPIQHFFTNAAFYVTLLSACGYLCAYQYEIGSSSAYKIPRYFVQLSIGQIVESIITVAFFLAAFIYFTYLTAIAIPRMLTKSEVLKSVLSSIFLSLLFYGVTCIVFEKSSHVRYVSPWAFYTVTAWGLVRAILHWWHNRHSDNEPPQQTTEEDDTVEVELPADELSVTNSPRVNEPKPKKKKGIVIQADPDTVYAAIFVAIAIIIGVPTLSNKLGYKNARGMQIYSVVLTPKGNKQLAVVKRYGDLVFAETYRKETFTDSLMILTSQSIDTLVLGRKELHFIPNKPFSIDWNIIRDTSVKTKSPVRH